MIYTKETLNKVDVEGKEVIVRLDLNVPVSHGQILDDNRIKASLATIQYLIDKNSKIIILSSKKELYKSNSTNLIFFFDGTKDFGCA